MPGIEPIAAGILSGLLGFGVCCTGNWAQGHCRPGVLHGFVLSLKSEEERPEKKTVCTFVLLFYQHTLGWTGPSAPCLSLCLCKTPSPAELPARKPDLAAATSGISVLWSSLHLSVCSHTSYCSGLFCSTWISSTEVGMRTLHSVVLPTSNFTFYR